MYQNIEEYAKRHHIAAGVLRPGCLVNTTAEIIIEELEDFIFTREPDTQSGYDELMIRKESREKQQ